MALLTNPPLGTRSVGSDPVPMIAAALTIPSSVIVDSGTATVKELDVTVSDAIPANLPPPATTGTLVSEAPPPGNSTTEYSTPRPALKGENCSTAEVPPVPGFWSVSKSMNPTTASALPLTG